MHRWKADCEGEGTDRHQEVTEGVCPKQPGEQKPSEERKQRAADDESGEGATGFGCTTPPEAQSENGKAGQGGYEVHAMQPDELVGEATTSETPRCRTGISWGGQKPATSLYPYVESPDEPTGRRTSGNCLFWWS
jgi:hypothetical protein